MRSFVGKHVRFVVGVAVVGLGLSAALAVATVPDNDGTVHACVITIAGAGTGEPAPGANLRVIDPASQACDPANQMPITISGRGAQGPPGPAGAPGASGQQGSEDCGAAVGHLTLTGNPALSSDVCAARQVRIGNATASRAQSQAGTTEYELTRQIDSVSPKLAKAAVQGTIFKSAKIQIFKPAATFKLSNVAISSYQLGLGNEQPTETLTLIAIGKKGS